MRLLRLSDLHIELWRDDGPDVNLDLAAPDVVILAGDIHVKSQAVAWAANKFPRLPVLYVMGNHESYGANLDEIEKNLLLDTQSSPNVTFLKQSEKIIGGVRFLGCTLWTDFKLFSDEPADRHIAMSEAGAVMNDYKRIRLAGKGYRKLQPGDTALFHAEQKSWLNAKLHEPFNGMTVVISHMAPSLKSVPVEFATDPISAAYASNLESLVELADLWVHGHMHDSSDYRIGKCRVVCNPRGYISRAGGAENINFNPNFVVDI